MINNVVTVLTLLGVVLQLSGIWFLHALFTKSNISQWESRIALNKLYFAQALVKIERSEENLARLDLAMEQAHWVILRTYSYKECIGYKFKLKNGFIPSFVPKKDRVLKLVGATNELHTKS
jgi:hypothetical protein